MTRAHTQTQEPTFVQEESECANWSDSERAILINSVTAETMSGTPVPVVPQAWSGKYRLNSYMWEVSFTANRPFNTASGSPWSPGTLVRWAHSSLLRNRLA